jgi:hypothetical protein
VVLAEPDAVSCALLLLDGGDLVMVAAERVCAVLGQIRPLAANPGGYPE